MACIFLAAASAPAPEALVPIMPGWVPGFLLMILWLFVAAILLGPLIRHFKLEPHSRQSFSDDRAHAAHRP
jgi:hypothetical protein